MVESLLLKKVLSFESHRTHSDPLFHHKLLYNNVPSDLHNTFTLLVSDFSYNIARNKNYVAFITHHVTTQSFGTYSIKFQCISTWHFFSKF